MPLSFVERRDAPRRRLGQTRRERSSRLGREGHCGGVRINVALPFLPPHSWIATLSSPVSLQARGLIPFHLLRQIPGYFHQDPSPPKTELRETSTSEPAEFKWHKNMILRAAFPSSPVPPCPSENAGPGSTFAGGARVAYDPRDLPLEAGEDPRIKDKQGYLSLWNDNISHAMRICILIELALRRRIGVVRDLGRKRSPLPDRPITVISTRQTGETPLDETLKMMKQAEDTGEKMGVGTWVDLLSVIMPMGCAVYLGSFACGSGRTAGAGAYSVPPSALDAEGTQCRIPRAVCLACAACTASVLDNAFGRLGYEWEADFGRRRGKGRRAGGVVGWAVGEGGGGGIGRAVATCCTPRCPWGDSTRGTGARGDDARYAMRTAGVDARYGGGRARRRVLRAVGSPVAPRPLPVGVKACLDLGKELVDRMLEVGGVLCHSDGMAWQRREGPVSHGPANDVRWDAKTWGRRTRGGAWSCRGGAARETAWTLERFGVWPFGGGVAGGPDPKRKLRIATSSAGIDISHESARARNRLHTTPPRVVFPSIRSAAVVLMLGDARFWFRFDALKPGIDMTS
ncbi:hypothetical protein DFH08DRAFT_819910 [Mycena albidolilacea]|uniref:Uncharacterized protein n=1 Tax=Mycena albidolilacea TaxID=1033008 RepID=A0AAD6ZDL3_9AGAR|nr:hypothetical protein DFH08DRAFT_819910 [Mycena albidolilacea]